LSQSATFTQGPSGEKKPAHRSGVGVGVGTGVGEGEGEGVGVSVGEGVGESVDSGVAVTAVVSADIDGLVVALTGRAEEHEASARQRTPAKIAEKTGFARIGVAPF
jgi:hypothetical protein